MKKSKRKKQSEKMQLRWAMAKLRAYIKKNVVHIDTSQCGDWQYCLRVYYDHLGVKKPNVKSSVLVLREYNRHDSPIYKGIRTNIKLGSFKNRKLEYKWYIHSQEWKDFKNEILNARGGKCEECEIETIQLDLHHKTYARLFEELPEDVVLLCRECHSKVHSKN